MKKISSFFQITFVIVFTVCCLNLFAQDKITLIWNVDDVTEAKSFACVTDGGIIINWGDGIIETIASAYGPQYHTYELIGEYEVNIVASDAATRFYQLYCPEQQVSKINFFDCTALVVVWCYNNQLTNLNLSGCSALLSLTCSNNQIFNLNLSGCTALTEILCNNNQLQLSDLYAVQQIVNVDNCDFGTQNLPITLKNIETELFSDQSVFEGVFTKYAVEIDGMPAPESNYAVIDGKLIFYKPNNYTVTMTNDAVGSPYDQAKVIVPIEVVQVGVKELEELGGVEVYPNPTTGELRVKSEELRVNNVEVYDVYGRKTTPPFGHPSLHGGELSHSITLNISDLPTGIYFVKISTEVGDVVKKVVKY